MIFSLIFLAACSQPADKAENPSSTKKDEVKQAASDVEGMLREGPGKYAGDKYDEEEGEAELDKLPDNMTADEAYNHLVALLAEDYMPEVKVMDELDPTIKTNRETPGGVNTPEGELPKQVNVEILLDASGSMAGRVSGGVKMDLAKERDPEFCLQIAGRSSGGAAGLRPQGKQSAEG